MIVKTPAAPECPDHFVFLTGSGGMNRTKLGDQIPGIRKSLMIMAWRRLAGDGCG